MNKKISFTKNTGKGSKEEFLPSRHALSKITKGDPAQRALRNYAKATPSGVGIDFPSIDAMSPRVIG